MFKKFLAVAGLIAMVSASAFAQQPNSAQLQDSLQFQAQGVSIGFNDNWQFVPVATNVTFAPVSLGTTDYLYNVGSPIASNTWLRVKNASPTNGFPLIVWGNDGTNYPNAAGSGEVGKARFRPDSLGFAHLKCTNGTAVAQIAWVPN